MSSIPEATAFGPDDCLMITYDSAKPPKTVARAVLMSGTFRSQDICLALCPYPKRDHATKPDRAGFPVRPRRGQDPKDEAEVFAANALQRMNEVLARIQELEEALDDPDDIWTRLRAAWKRAEDEEDPRMSEIVKQARQLRPVLTDLEKRIRRVLRRHRELTPLDRVQEMDRASMVWLSRQPGRSVAERAGSDQRILATVRRENFDTLENRVLHAYTRLAADAAREWIREHPRARQSARFRDVDTFRKKCKSIAADLKAHDVLIATPGVTPNYVLMQDKSYHQVHDGWERLLKREKAIDDLWAWQAQTWTDFAVLAVTLAIDELEEAQLVAQSPIVWKSEAATGRWFEQDRPIAVFWLRETGRIVEVQARPEQPGPLLIGAQAHVALRITDPARSAVPRRVAVWTPHAMNRIDLGKSVSEVANLIDQLQQFAQTEVFKHGLVLTPDHGEPETVKFEGSRCRVNGIAFGASGKSLAAGMEAIRGFVRDEFKGASA